MKALLKLVQISSLLLYMACLRDLQNIFAARLITTMKRETTFREIFRL